ncbi:hypothetical protein CR513_05474, partial [Mucuna pruriens]
MSAIVQNLKMQVGQLANSISQLHSVGSGNLPSQKTSKSKKECERSITKKWKRITSSTAVETEIRWHRVESDEELLKMFQKLDESQQHTFYGPKKGPAKALDLSRKYSTKIKSSWSGLLLSAKPSHETQQLNKGAAQ